MEEFYDYSSEGHIGVKTNGESLSLGAGGAGRRISKRVYRFRGNTALTVDVVGEAQPIIPPDAAR